MKRAWGLAAMAVTAAATGGLLAGCGTFNLLSDDNTEQATITAIRLDDAGAITLTTLDGPGPSRIHREVRYAGDRPGPTTRMDGSTLVLSGCGSQCDVEYTVRVPKGVAVTGKVQAGETRLTGVSSVDVRGSAGGITVTDATGPVRVESSAGQVRVDRVMGTVDAWSSAGGVQVSDVTGAVTMHSSAGAVVGTNLRGPRTEAHSSGGRITLDLGTVQDVDAQSSAGGIDLTVPQATYDVHATSTAGDTHIDVPNDPAAPHKLTLDSTAGAITVHTH